MDIRRQNEYISNPLASPEIEISSNTNDRVEIREINGVVLRVPIRNTCHVQ